MNVVDELIKIALLGATWVLYLLFALSVLSIAAMVERWLFFRKNRAGGDKLRQDLLAAIAARDEARLDAALAASKTVEAEVLRQAMLFRDGGSAAFLDAVESGLASERAGLDRGTVLLGTIGNNAPFVGLFGTVLGIIEAFSYLGTGDQAAMGNVMSGISEALVATAVGIFVAIPAVIGFNVAQKKAGELENSVLSLARLLSAWLKLAEAHAEAEAHDPDNLARLPDRSARRALGPIRSGGT
ncbi:MotA/TolQ/ExbB proton channel family protein [Nannocystis punicea]|uniref:MotA/TolQ/ExbB proton channel family protein n=1 Tax=Nannocystis punicea TaxID=2995304 RepID=A0ABY7GXD8_9BACT|nr:MotA/TolQ/ExbB proton channel family protein [Nannocystis poenicansa]WAS91643.1 MotA/TolQ/ExbB proton channel family protein [Nannocystis poenicansa]